MWALRQYFYYSKGFFDIHQHLHEKVGLREGKKRKKKQCEITCIKPLMIKVDLYLLRDLKVNFHHLRGLKIY